MPFKLIPYSMWCSISVLVLISAALRFCRKIIGVKDEFYNRYITKGKLLVPIIQAFEDNGDKYNMINSAVIELFEFIRIVSVIFFFTWELFYIRCRNQGFSVNS